MSANRITPTSFWGYLHNYSAGCSSCAWLGNSRSAMFAIIFIFIHAGVATLNASDSGAAIRQTISWYKWPTAFYQTGLFNEADIVNQNLTRIWYNSQFGDVRFRSALEFNLRYQSMRLTNQTTGWVDNRGATRAVNTGNRFFKTGTTLGESEIEAFEFAFRAAGYDFQIGRQPISLGTSHYVSILDIIAPFHPGYLDSSYKPGVDAIRIRTHAGQMGEAELIAVIAQNTADSAFIGRYRDTFSGFDLEFLAGRFRKRHFMGIGWEGEKNLINYWGEVALFERRNRKDPNFGGFSDNLAFSGIFGMERETGRDWRSGIAYMHQDFGARSIDHISAAQSSSPMQQGWMHLTASDYMIFNVTRTMNHLSTLNMNAIYNLRDSSLLFQPVIRLDTSQSSDIALFAWINSGKNPEFANGNISLRSEFASHPMGAGVIYRLYY